MQIGASSALRKWQHGNKVDIVRVLTPLNLLLAAIIVYIPYVQHFSVVLPMKGLNLINIMFLVAFVWLLLRKGKTITPTPLKKRFLLFFAMLFFAFVLAFFADASRVMDDLTTLKTYVFYLLFYFLFYFAVRDTASIRFLFGVILFVTFLVSLHAVRQGIDYGIGNYAETHRASGPFAPDYRGANLAAGFLVIFVPLFVAVVLLYRSKISYRLVALFCSALGVLAVFVTYSRQAYLILAALFLLHALRRNTGIGIVIALAVAGYELWAPASVIERIQMTEQTDNSGEQVLDHSTESRFIIWEGAAKLIAERPLGIGLNRFKSEIGRHVPDFKNFDAHNGFLLLTTESGIFSLIVFLTLLIGLFGLARKVIRLDSSEDTQLIGNAYLVSLLGVVLCNLFGSRLFNGEVMGNFWVLSGLVARYYTLTLEAQSDASLAGSTGERSAA
jgi:O-antigen ligase